MNIEEAKKKSTELMEISEAAYLTSVDSKGFPQTRAMLNLRNKEQFPALYDIFNKPIDNFSIYFTTNASSPKVDQFIKNPAASVYYCKPSEWRGLMIGGNIEIVTDQKIKKRIWQKDWELYYPGGADAPDYTILCLSPLFAKYYHQLQFAEINFR